VPKSIPFAELRRGVIPQYLHAELSVKAMLVLVDKALSSATVDDLAGAFGTLIDKPDTRLLADMKRNVQTAAAAAALVFMHSAYENAIFELIERLVFYDPDVWTKSIEKKTIPFERVASSDVSSIRDNLFADWLDVVEKESLLKKVERVLGVLQSPTVKGVINGFDFELEELKMIDQLRHEATHRPDFSTPLEDVTGKLRYLHCTVLLLEKIAEQKYPGDAVGERH
jgi:hypothetical protein